MKARGVPGPEFNRGRDHAKPGPEGRTRHDALAEARASGGYALLENGRRFEHGALLGCPGADLRFTRPRREVRVSLLVGNTLDAALHPHLLVERRPVKTEGRKRVR